MLQIVFGNGRTEEWYNFSDGEGKPGTFDVFTDVALTPELMQRLGIVLKRIKKESAHLRKFRIERDVCGALEFGSVYRSRLRNTFYSANEEVSSYSSDLLFASVFIQRIKNYMEGGV